MINKQLPDATVYFMSVKQSLSRANHFAEVAKANELIKNYLANKPNSGFIDVNTILLKDNSIAPDSSLFEADCLHLNHKGYDKWQSILEPYVN